VGDREKEKRVGPVKPSLAVDKKKRRRRKRYRTAKNGAGRRKGPTPFEKVISHPKNTWLLGERAGEIRKLIRGKKPSRLDKTKRKSGLQPAARGGRLL